jgi:hypothetical protein
MNVGYRSNHVKIFCLFYFHFYLISASIYEFFHGIKALGSVWECVFKKIICVFKSNRNFGVFGIAILKKQILKS